MSNNQPKKKSASAESAAPEVPIVALDGPSGSGKGTIAQALSNRLNWNYLESGALYRVLGLLAEREGVDSAEVDRLADMASNLNLAFRQGAVWLGKEEIGEKIRTEQVGKLASRVAALPEVREALLHWQRKQAQMPGLIADGRDMGTVVFPAAACKIFLTAQAEIRAERRFNQLKQKGFDVNMHELLQDIQQRDYRDMNRSVSPLKRADDAFELDTTNLSIEQAVSAVFAQVKKTSGFGLE